jgi:hypothetical protein
MQTIAIEETVARRFRLAKAPTLVVQPEGVSPVAFTWLRDEGPFRGVRRDKAALSSGCKSHPATSLQPEATGAGMEATKCLKPLVSGSRIGDRASVQAAT